MIIWFICFMFGHKVMLKAFTGRTIAVTDRLSWHPIDVPTYKWEKQKHCIRCGKKL